MSTIHSFFWIHAAKHFPKQSSMILEVGSYQLPLLAHSLGLPHLKSLWPSSKYIGIDLEPGPGVDIVLNHPFEYPFAPNIFDLVISSAMLEHCTDPQRAIFEMKRVLKPGGFLFLLTTSSWPEHRFPKDYWRFLPDGLKHLINQAGLELKQLKSGRAWPQFWGIEIFAIAIK